MKKALAATLLFFAFIPVASAQTLERGNGADPLTLDPQRATTAAEANILRDLYEGLVTYDAAGNLIPGAATGWTISNDGLTYTFTIRVASWSNGIPVTAVDFERAFERLFDPEIEAPDASMFAGIDAVRADDARTLVIELNEPDPLFLHLLARPAALPIYRNFRTVSQIPAVNQPVNGAYRFDGYEPGVGIWLIRNDDYYAANEVAYQSVIYRPYERQRALAAFADGDIQISNDVPVFALGELAETYGAAFHEAPYAGSFFLAANTDGALADPMLRRAVALAIDRLRLSEEIWLTAMIPTLTLLPPGLADQTAPAGADLGPNDPPTRIAEAQAILDAAGFNADNPLTLTLAVSDGSLQQETGAAIAEDLAAIGVVVDLVVRSPAAHQSDLLGDRDYDLATVAWIGVLGHVDEFLSLFEPGPLDITGHADPAVEGFLVEARMTTDATVRSALYAAADRIIAADLPAIALMHYASINLVSPDVEGWEDNVIDVHLTRWLHPPVPEAEATDE